MHTSAQLGTVVRIDAHERGGRGAQAVDGLVLGEGRQLAHAVPRESQNACGAANLEAGKTNSFGALMAALGVDEKKGAEKGYTVDVDTIFFLSDGYPSYGRFIETDDVLREVRKANQLRGVVIHTIALGEFEKDFMRRLAHENGGTFVDLGS